MLNKLIILTVITLLGSVGFMLNKKFNIIHHNYIEEIEGVKKQDTPISAKEEDKRLEQKDTTNEIKNEDVKVTTTNFDGIEIACDKLRVILSLSHSLIQKFYSHKDYSVEVTKLKQYPLSSHILALLNDIEKYQSEPIVVHFFSSNILNKVLDRLFVIEATNSNEEIIMNNKIKEFEECMFTSDNAITGKPQ